MKAPKLPTFIKQKKPNRFEYRFRYYNDKKERMKERYDRIAAELDVEKGGKRLSENEMLFRSRLRESWERSSQRANQTHKSSLRFILILAGLLFLAWFMLH